MKRRLEFTEDLDALNLLVQPMDWDIALAYRVRAPGSVPNLRMITKDWVNFSKKRKHSEVKKPHRVCQCLASNVPMCRTIKDLSEWTCSEPAAPRDTSHTPDPEKEKEKENRGMDVSVGEEGKHRSSSQGASNKASKRGPSAKQAKVGVNFIKVKLRFKSKA